LLGKGENFPDLEKWMMWGEKLKERDPPLKVFAIAAGGGMKRNLFTMNAKKRAMDVL